MAKLSPSPTANRCFQECSSCYILGFLFGYQLKFLEILSFFIVLVKRSNLLGNEDLSRQKVNRERERRVYRAWRWGRSAISKSTFERDWGMLWGVRTTRRRRVGNYFFSWSLRFWRESRKIQKEWSLKKKHSLFKSSTEIKWRDITFMISNVCVPKRKKRRCAKMARNSLLSHVSILNVIMVW